MTETGNVFARFIFRRVGEVHHLLDLKLLDEPAGELEPDVRQENGLVQPSKIVARIRPLLAIDAWDSFMNI